MKYISFLTRNREVKLQDNYLKLSKIVSKTLITPVSQADK
jgi:hypothetical protein